MQDLGRMVRVKESHVTMKAEKGRGHNRRGRKGDRMMKEKWEGCQGWQEPEDAGDLWKLERSPWSLQRADSPASTLALASEMDLELRLPEI